MAQRFSASAAAKLMACPGSADLELSIPGFVYPVEDPDKGAKGKGHLLHTWLQGAAELPPQDLIHMAQALTYYAEIRSRRRFKVLAEQMEIADWLVSKPPTTADVVLYLRDELHIIDWKTGKIPVSVFDNEQLLFYALTYSKWAPEADGVHLHIIQPWADNMQSTFVTTKELEAFMLKAIAAEQLVLNHSTKLNPTDKGCMFCPAFPHARGDKGNIMCPAAMKVLYPPLLDIQGVIDA